MKLLCLADIHSHPDVLRLLPKIAKEVDRAVVAGDLTHGSLLADSNRETFLALDAMKIPVYITPGNHDMWPVSFLNMDHVLRSRCHLLRVITDNMVNILDSSGFKNFWFSPWSMKFGCWNWMRSVAEDTYYIPEDTDIVVTHGPALGCLDECTNGDHAGSYNLYEAICKTRAKIIISGHIHGNDYKHFFSKDGNQLWMNCSVLNEEYEFKGEFPVLDTETLKVDYKSC